MRNIVVLPLLALLCCVALAIDSGSSASSPISTKPQQELREYWTPERMASAIPLNGKYVNKKSQNGTLSQPDGPAKLWKPYAGDDGGQARIISPLEINAPEILSYPFPYTSAYAPSYTTYPWRAVGKVFFTQGTTDYVCSGATVTQYMIYTAGHCVWSQSLSEWSTNFQFVPGYNDGVAPYGVFNAYQLWVWTGYQDGNEGYDFGIAVIQTSGGNGVGAIVGWFGAAWNYGYSLSWRALGYPQAAPFTGLWDYYCDASLGIQDTNYNPNTIGIGCDTTGGASGGPWVYLFGSSNYINSVNAYKYTSPAEPLAIYGPYFGTASADLFNDANAVVPN